MSACTFALQVIWVRSQREDQPFLRSICWQGESPALATLSDQEMLQLYERNWRYRGVLADLSEREKAILLDVATKYQSWLVSELHSCDIHTSDS
ncbi:MAG: hypothetical protein AAFP20_14985 [Cyanobacteria bacterium J06614_10]